MEVQIRKTKKYLEGAISLFLKAIVSLLFLTGNNANSQNDTLEQIQTMEDVKGFYAGFYVGSLFAGKSTASMYDGYGFNTEGTKNDFINSFMYRRIVLEYGGMYGQTDYIAQELNVDPGKWNFNASDMPINLKYNTAFLIGIQARYCFTDKNAIIANANVSKLSISGNFTITVITPPIANQHQNNIRTFSIIGEERRSIIQLGYQRIMGQDKKLNFFIEGGLSANQIKLTKNQAFINNLHIDLMGYYYQPHYNSFTSEQLAGIGLGIFCGAGLNLNMHPKWTIQMLYSPSYEKINIGNNERALLQQALGIRGYYHL